VKLLIKLLLSLLVLAVVLPFTPFMPGGKPLLKMDGLKWPPLAAPDLARPNPATDPGSANNQTFYKWRDAKGTVHYGDQPPGTPTGQVETIEVNPDTNLILGLKVPPPPPEQKPAPEGAATSLPSAYSPYSPGQIERLFEEAHKVKAQSEERNRQLEELVGGDR
jgi:hypothetical protein